MTQQPNPPLGGDEALEGRISEALWNVMHGYDGRLLTDEFYPGHDAIVKAILSTIKGDA